MPRFVPGTDLFSSWQRFGCFRCGQAPSFPVAHTEVVNLPMSGIPKCLSGAGGPAPTPTIEGNFASFWKIIEVLIHLVHGNVNRIRYCSGLLNFSWRADVDDHQRFHRSYLFFQVGDGNSFRCFIFHMGTYDTSAMPFSSDSNFAKGPSYP